MKHSSYYEHLLGLTYFVIGASYLGWILFGLIGGNIVVILLGLVGYFVLSSVHEGLTKKYRDAKAREAQEYDR